MKRKVSLHGQTTLTVSLPSKWVKKFDIKKGDELNLEEYGKELRVSNSRVLCLHEKQVDIGDQRRLGRSYLSSLYRTGFDQVHLFYHDNNYVKVIRDMLSKELLGFEIIKQGNNYCLIKDLTGYSKDELDNALRRIWLLTLDLSKESLDAIKKQDIDALKSIELMDYSINKFSNFCLRILIKKGHFNFRKTPVYYHLIKNLEHIADQYKDLCSFYLNNRGDISNGVIIMFNKVNEHLNAFYEVFYTYDQEEMENLFRKTKVTHNRLLRSESGIGSYLAMICRDIRNLLSVVVEINL